MSNGLVDLMQLYAEQNAKNDNSIKCVAGKIVAVTDDMFRADIELGQGQVVKDMMNKSGEKLKVGDTVWIEYFTYPSSGWIARRNGEPDPMGGGGASTTVENATVLVPTNFHDFVIEEELILDIQPPNMLYYGRDTALVCIQGHYMLQIFNDSSSISQDENGEWLIDGSKEICDTLIDNLDKFGSQIGTEDVGGFLLSNIGSSGTSSTVYPPIYGWFNVRLVSVTSATQSGVKYLRYTVAIDQHKSNTNAPTGDWWDETMTWGATSLTSTNLTLRGPGGLGTANTNFYSDSILKGLYFIPTVLPYNTNEKYARKLDTPYGYASMRYPIIVAVLQRRTTGEEYFTLTNIDMAGSNRYGLPLISDAEKCFALGLTKRTEPVPVNGGGT